MQLNRVNRFHISIESFLIVVSPIILGHEKVVRAVIEFGANVDAQDENRETPLIRAALKGE